MKTEPLSVTRQNFDQWMLPIYAPAPFVPVSAKGSRVWDQNGQERIDFTSGIAVNVLGHCHPELVSTIAEQASKVWHLSNGFTNEPTLRLAKRLIDATFADRAFFCNSGAEANEAAFKLARRVAFNRSGPHKNEIVAATKSFHGRTYFSVSVGGQPQYSQGFGPAIEGIRHVDLNGIAALRDAVSSKTCAIVLEPVQGEGGVIPADQAYLEEARALCDEHGALLIFDEVQTGVGRTGELFAYQHYGVIPDLLTSAKGLGGGSPIGALLSKDEYAEHFSPGTHGTTYGGNPLACAVAEKVIQLVDTPSMREGVRVRHQRFVKRLEVLAQTYGVFEAPRGLGLLLGCPLTAEWQGKAKVIVTKAAQEGLMVLQAGPEVLRFAPSLNVEDADIDEGLDRLERALSLLVKQP